MKKIRIAWERLIDSLMVVFFAFYTFSCLNFFVRQLMPPPKSYILTIVLAVILLAVALLLKKLSIRNRAKIKCCACIMSATGIINKSKCIQWLVFFCLPLLIKLLLIFLLPTSIGGDIEVYRNISFELASNGCVITNANFSLEFPHLFWFGVFLLPASMIARSSIAHQVYLAILLSLGNILLYDGLTGLFEKSETSSENNKLAPCLIAIFYSWLPSQLFAPMAVTHEMGLIFLFTLLIFLFSHYKNAKKGSKWILWGFICVLCSIMRLVNSMGLIVTIAIILTTLIVEDGTVFKKAIKVGALCLVVILVGGIAENIQYNYTDTNERPNSSPYIWSVLVGGNYESEGRYSSEDLEMIQDEMLNRYGTVYAPIEQKNEIIKEKTVQRWSELIKNPAKFALHLLNKFCNVWSGTHYSIELVEQYCNSRIASFLLYGLVVLNDGIYFLCCYITFRELIKRCKKCITKEPVIIVFAQTVLCGGVAVLLITEVCNKYHLSMFVALAIIIGYCIAVSVQEKEKKVYS